MSGSIRTHHPGNVDHDSPDIVSLKNCLEMTVKYQFDGTSQIDLSAI